MIWTRLIKALPTSNNFSWYLWNFFLDFIDKISQKTVLFKSIATVKELSLYVFPFWRYWTSLKNKKTHYVIKNSLRSNWLLLGVFYVKFRSTISQNVDEIFQFWKVIWTRLITELSTAYNVSWYLEKYFFLYFIEKICQKTALFEYIATAEELFLYVFPFWRYWTSSKNKKTHYVLKKSHYVIIDSCSAYFMLNFVRRYLKMLMRYFNFEKWSELGSSRRFPLRTTFRDIFEK